MMSDYCEECGALDGHGCQQKRIDKQDRCIAELEEKNAKLEGQLAEMKALVGIYKDDFRKRLKTPRSRKR